MNIADMAIDAFVAESMLLRVMKLENEGRSSGIHRDMLSCFLYDAADRMAKNGKDAVNSFAEGDEQRMILMGIRRFTKAQPFNVKEARRRIADHLISEQRYPF